MRKFYDKNLVRAQKLQKWVNETFTPATQYDKFVAAMQIDVTRPEDVDYVWVSDFFTDQFTGGADYWKHSETRTRGERIIPEHRD